MKNIDKKMTFLIPAYNGLSWLEKNKDFWVDVANLVDVVLIEDSNDKKMKDFCNDNNIRYFSKDNGNWGSVINFAKTNRIINTEWMAIVDVDDVINIKELKKLLESLDSSADVFYTSWTKKDFKTQEYSVEKSKWIHSAWFKTSLLYEIADLPEKSFYMDWLVMLKLQSKDIKKVNRLDINPYIYFVNIDGQSTNFSSSVDLLKKLQDYVKIERNFDKFCSESKISSPRKMIKKYKFCLSPVLRAAYEKADFDLREELNNLYIQNYSHVFVPIFKRLIWSKVYLFFKRK